MNDSAKSEEQRPAAGKDSPHLEDHEREQAAESRSMSAQVIHELLREEGEIELKRPAAALMWSGLAAGLSMGFSFLTLALLRAALHDTAASEIVAPFGYAVGFLIVVLGKQQLFTETTLTASLPLMHQPSASGFLQLARMWAVVLVANLVGTVIFAAALSISGVMKPEVAEALLTTAKASLADNVFAAAVRALFSGWLIALMVWLLPASGAAAPFIIVALTYIVGLAGFPHIIAGSAEAVYAVIHGAASVKDYLVRFLAPALLGNMFGGTALAALLNHAPVAHDFAARENEA